MNYPGLSPLSYRALSVQENTSALLWRILQLKHLLRCTGDAGSSELLGRRTSSWLRRTFCGKAGVCVVESHSRESLLSDIRKNCRPWLWGVRFTEVHALWSGPTFRGVWAAEGL